MFLGSPLQGSPDADVGHLTLALGSRVGYSSELAEILRPDSEHAIRAQDDWHEWYFRIKPPMVTFTESGETKLPLPAVFAKRRLNQQV